MEAHVLHHIDTSTGDLTILGVWLDETVYEYEQEAQDRENRECEDTICEPLQYDVTSYDAETRHPMLRQLSAAEAELIVSAAGELWNSGVGDPGDVLGEPKKAALAKAAHLWCMQAEGDGT